MRVPLEREALRQVGEKLAELLDIPVTEVHEVHLGISPAPDAVFKIEQFRAQILVEWRETGTSAAIFGAIRALERRWKDWSEAVTPDSGLLKIALIAVPFMGKAGEALCSNSGVGWLDLCGNANLRMPTRWVGSIGHRNRFKRLGRPANVFAPKSARIARWLLMHALTHARIPISQRDLAHQTAMDEGFTSRILAKLESDDLVTRDAEGRIRSRPGPLFDAWRERYDFSKHHLVKGHIAARSGDELLLRMARWLDERGRPYAATGLAGAWLISQFAGFRIVTLYLPEWAQLFEFEELGFREEERGSNVWLVIPNDQGVFHGAGRIRGVRCVHPVQASLDLKAHPERSLEALLSLETYRLSPPTEWQSDA